MPQQIDVPGMGIVEFPDGMDDNAIAAAIQKNIAPPDRRPFTEKLGSFFQKVRENPPPFLGGLATLPKRATEAATELTYGADPEAAREAAGTMLEAAGAATPMAPRGTGGIFARPTAPAGTPIMPPPPAPRPTSIDPALEAAGRLGVDIPRYMATESTAIPQMAAGIKNVPMAGQPIVTSAERLAEQMGTVKRGLGAGTAETAGERAKTGLTGFIKTESQRPVRDAYRAVDELVDPAVRVPLDNTRAMVGEIMAERTAARIPGRSKAVETVFDAVQDPAGMDYAGTKGLRSFLMERSPQELAVSGLAPTEVKRLTKALTDDLKTVLRESGPEAFGKWQEANALARLTAMQRAALSKITGVAGDAAPEMVFNRLAGYAQGKGGADLARLRLAKRTMGSDAWNEFGSALINRLGHAPDGQFSAQRFVTAFGNMAPAARNELFTGQQHAALQDLFTVSQFVKDRIGRFENVSGTSRGMFGGGMLTGALADPISLIGGMVGTRLLAEALSRPAIVRAATAVTRAQLRGNPVATRRTLEQLYKIALRTGLISAAQQRPIEARQAGGPVEEDRPYLVGEAGPEVFVPDDPWARAAARTGRRGRQEGAGTRFVEGGYGIPSLYKMLDKGAQDAFESAGKLQHYGNEYYDPAPVVQQAIGAAGAPLVAPAQAGAVLGAGAIRRARPGIGHNNPPPEARFSQYAEAYPENVPGGVLKTDKKTGKEYTSRLTTPEADEFMAAREAISEDMKKGYDPYYDPAKRTLVDPSNYPGRNIDTLEIRPKTQKSIDNYLAGIDAPITRERLREAYRRGTELGNADNWYFMGQLEKDFVKELGPVEGRKAFLDRFASGMAATTSGQQPTTNYLMSHYLNYLEQTGKPMPKGGWEIPAPVSGQYMMSNVDDYMRMRREGGYMGLGENQPKMHNFARSFIGDLDRAVMDDQMAKGMVGHMAGVDKNFANNARKAAFGLLEQPLHLEAAAAGVRPGAYQDVAWAGFKSPAGKPNVPGKPMISHINDAIERTHRLTGMPKEEIVRRGIIRNEIPVYGFSAPMPSMGDTTEE